MTDINAAFVKHMKDSAAVGAVIGDRIYPLSLPAGVTLPAATYQFFGAAWSPDLTKLVTGGDNVSIAPRRGFIMNSTDGINYQVVVS